MKKLTLMSGLAAACLVGCATTDPHNVADSDQDGAVSFDEFDAYMKQAVFAGLDLDGDGNITKEEWRKANPGKPESRFDEADKEGNGFVTRAEADAEFDRRGSFRKLFTEIDTDGDGWLSRAETEAFRRTLDAQAGANRLEQLSNATR